MRALHKLITVCAVLGAGAGFVLSRPAPIDPDFAAGHVPDVENGAVVFTAAGCASCHAADNAQGDDKLVLTGGHALVSDFGTFYAPNISPSDQGIGGWTLPEFARAMTQGVGPEGQHLYPAFPYSAYQHMTEADVSDLFAYIQGLPKSDVASRDHDIGFPFNIRRGVGLWKQAFIRSDYVLTGEMSAQVERGRYLVEALAHCGECHTQRGIVGDLEYNAWLTGAENPSGKGRIPNISPSGLDWSDSEVVYYLESGFTPDYDSAGGSMAAVVSNLAQLPKSDIEAIVAYLRDLP